MGFYGKGVLEMKRISLVILAFVVAASAVGIGTWAYLTFAFPGLFNTIATSNLPCRSGATATSGQTHFTIIVSGQGFNSSRYSVSCPLMSVTKGQSVTIHLVNNDRETHSVAITHYLAGGVELAPGQSRDITFTADQVGSFVVYCNIGCFAHNYMQNGRLNVTD